MTIKNELTRLGVFDNLLVVDGDFPKAQFFNQYAFKNTLATDGAAIRLLQAGHTPDKIIGDLDSLFSQTPSGVISDLTHIFPNSEIIHKSEQDTTDFQKALDYLVESNMRNIEVIGLFGGDLDHALCNLFLFGRYAPTLNLRFYHQVKTHVVQWGWLVHQDTRFTVPTNTPLSLLPLESAQLSTKGLKWDLDDSILKTSGHMSVRNLTAASHVHMHIKTGAVLCIVHLAAGLEPLINQKSV